MATSSNLSSSDGIIKAINNLLRFHYLNHHLQRRTLVTNKMRRSQPDVIIPNTIEVTGEDVSNIEQEMGEQNISFIVKVAIKKYNFNSKAQP